MSSGVLVLTYQDAPGILYQACLSHVSIGLEPWLLPCIVIVDSLRSGLVREFNVTLCLNFVLTLVRLTVVSCGMGSKLFIARTMSSRGLPFLGDLC